MRLNFLLSVGSFIIVELFTPRDMNSTLDVPFIREIFVKNEVLVQF